MIGNAAFPGSVMVVDGSEFKKKVSVRQVPGQEAIDERSRRSFWTGTPGSSRSGGRSLEPQDYQIGILGDGGRKIGDGHIRLFQRKPDGGVVVRAIRDPSGGLTGGRYQTNRINLGK